MQTSVRCLDQKFVRMDSVQISFLHTPATVAVASTTTTSGLSVWVRNFICFLVLGHRFIVFHQMKPYDRSPMSHASVLAALMKTTFPMNFIT